MKWVRSRHFLSSGWGAGQGGHRRPRPSLPCQAASSTCTVLTSSIYASPAFLSFQKSPRHWGACLLCVRHPECGLTHSLPGVAVFLSFPRPKSQPNHFSPLPIQIHVCHSYSLGCTEVHLQTSHLWTSQQFSLGVVCIWIRFLCVHLGREAPHLFTLPSWSIPPQVSFFKREYTFVKK